jgi:hypothetical protein
LREQLSSERPSYSKLLELQMNMRQNYLGLEYPQYTRLRDSMERFANAARFSLQSDGFLKFMQQSLDDTIEQLDKAEEIDSALEFRLGNLVNNLYQSNQSPQALRDIRSSFGYSNLVVEIDQRLVNRLVSRHVSRPRPVDECILGTRVLGHAFLDGNVNASLMPMNGGVGLQLNLAGCMTSQNRGYNRGVVLNTSSISPVIASKQIFISPNGFSTTQPQVSTQLQSTIHSIEHRSRLVTRIASRRAGKQKPEADAIAEGKLRTRLAEEFGSEVDQQAAEAYQQLAELKKQPRPEIKRIGLQRPELALYTTHSKVDASAVQATAYQLAAPSPCPLARPASALVVAQIHQSAVGNSLDSVLAGRVLRNKDLGSYMKQMSAEITDEMREEIDGEDWSITFSPYRPVQIEFEDGLVSVGLRVIRMTREKETLNEALSIRASYLPSFDGQVLTLTRHGEVSVTSDGETPGLKATAIRSFMKSKFDKTFRESIVTDQLDFGQFPRVNELGLNLSHLQFTIDQGWLQVCVP